MSATDVLEVNKALRVFLEEVKARAERDKPTGTLRGVDEAYRGGFIDGVIETCNQVLSATPSSAAQDKETPA